MPPLPGNDISHPPTLVRRIFIEKPAQSGWFFEIIEVYQVEVFREDKAKQKTFGSWHYHVLIRKP